MRNRPIGAPSLKGSMLLTALLIATATSNPAIASPEFRGKLDPASVAALERDLKLTPEELQRRSSAEQAAVETERTLRDSLGATFGGAWLVPDEQDGVKLVVAATDLYGVDQVRAAGATPKLVVHSLERLEAIREQLDAASMVDAAPDSIAAWYVDAPTNQVVVDIVMSEPVAAESAMNYVVRSGVDMRTIRFNFVKERPEPVPNIRGGNHYVNTSKGLSCSMGFSVRKHVFMPTEWERDGFLTAGHCGDVNDSVSSNGTQLGGFESSKFPGRDSAFVAINNFSWTARPWVNNYSGGNVSVRGKQEASVGAAVCRSGYATGYRCGTIVSKNVTVNYPQGTVFDLTRINACVGFGDSGGAVITPAGQAQGVTSGGQIPSGQSNNCGVSEPVTFIEPYKKMASVVGFVVLHVE